MALDKLGWGLVKGCEDGMVGGGVDHESIYIFFIY